jgi:hypothetical protein
MKSMPLERVLARLKNVKTSGSDFLALCPAHDDKTPSLSIAEGGDGRVLLHCHAGCSTEAVIEACGLDYTDLFEQKPESAGGLPKKRRIVATYHYYDSDGTLTFRVVRYDPKDFRQQHPDGYGDWKWGRGGADPILYRLPEVLEARREGRRIFVVEGEKDVESLEALGLVATCSPGGASRDEQRPKWRDDLHGSVLAGAHVVVIPDNDEPGRAHAAAVVRSLVGVASEVRLVDLPRIGEKGDVSDWVAGGGTADELDTLARAAVPIDSVCELERSSRSRYDDRLDSASVSGTAEWVPFPLEALPATCADYASSAAAAIDCDPAFVATSLLGVMAAAVGNAHRVAVKATWNEVPALWLAVVANSGGGKSPSIDYAMRPVYGLEREARERYRQEREAYEADLERYQGRPKQERNPEEKPQPPQRCRYRTGDTTIESLLTVHEENPRGLLCQRDELAGWLGSFDRYARGESDAQTWIEMWGGRPVVVDRKTSDKPVLHVERPNVSVLGGIQPEVLKKRASSQLIESGFMARLLLLMPPEQPLHFSMTDVHIDLMDRYDALVRAMYALPEGESAVPLTPQALETFASFQNGNADLYASLKGPLRSALVKLPSYVARIALVLHLADTVEAAAGLNTSMPPVTGDAMRRAVTLAMWFRYETARVYETLRLTSAPPQDRDSRLAEQLPETFGWSDVASRWGVQKRAAYNVIKRLTERGLVEDAGHGSFRKLNSECTIHSLHSEHFRGLLDASSATAVQEVHGLQRAFGGDGATTDAIANPWDDEDETGLRL